MRKIYTLLTLLLLWAGTTVMAQTVLVSDAPTNDGWATKTYWFTLYCAGQSKYLVYNSSATDAYNVALDSESSDNALWCFVASNDGYKLYNKGAGTANRLALELTSSYVTTGGSGGYDKIKAKMLSTSTDATNTLAASNDCDEWSYTEENSALYFYLTCSKSNSGGKTYLNYVSDGMTGWNNNDATQWTDSQFTIAGGDDYTKALLEAMDLAALPANLIYNPTQAGNEAVTNAIANYGEANTSENTTALQNAVNTAKNSIPSLSTTESTRVIMANRGRTGRYVHVKYGNAVGSGSDNSEGTWLGGNTGKDDYSYIMTLIPSTTDGVTTYKLYNEYYNKYVGSTPTANDAEYPLVESADNAGSYTIERINGTYYVKIYDKTYTATSSYGTLNSMHMGQDWDGIVRWTQDNPSSHYSLDPVSAETLATSLNESIKENAEAAKMLCNATYIGYPSYTDETKVSAFNTAYESFTANSNGTTYRALETALRELKATNTTNNSPESGHYYTITSAQDTNYKVYADYTNSKAIASTDQTNTVPSLWTFVSTKAPSTFTNSNSHTFYLIQGANDESTALSLCAWNTEPKLVESSNAYPYVIMSSSTTATGDNSGNSNYVSIANAVSLQTFNSAKSTLDGTLAGYNGGSLSSGSLFSYNGTGNYYNNWYVQEATEIPITVSAVGYATVNLPFAISLDGTGLTANTATDGGTEVTLSAIENGIVPAKTPVILTSGLKEAKTFTATILYDNTDSPLSGNDLQGTLTPATIDADAKAYILKDGTQGIGMYLVNSETDRTIPANKAYLGSTSVTENTAAMKEFNFGHSTGISTVQSDKSDTYYDLQGHRVLFPVHGVYVKGNGQKVYIK